MEQNNGSRFIKYWPIIMGTIALIGFLYVLDFRVRAVEADVARAQEDIETLTEILQEIRTDAAVTATKTERIERDVQDIKSWFGIPNITLNAENN